MKPLLPVPSSIAVLVLLVALVGFADAAYLTIEHFRGSIPPCSVASGIFGCDTVLTSVYSTVAGIPVSLFGAVYYLFVMIGAFAYIEGKREKIFRWSLALIFLGFLATLVLVYIMAFVLNAWCLYCLISVATSTTLFATALFVFKKYRDTGIEPSHS